MHTEIINPMAEQSYSCQQGRGGVGLQQTEQATLGNADQREKQQWNDAK